MFLSYIHNLRGVAILFIVASHCFGVFDWSESPWAFRILDVVTTNGTVMFVFISGFLFQYLSTRFSYRRYLSAKFRYVILPYLIISVPAIAFRLVAHSEINGLTEAFYEENSPLAQILWFLATGAHLGPLWFIPVIALFYVIAPALVWLDRDRRIYWLLPLLIVAGSFVHRPLWNVDPFHAFLHLLPAYMAGMFASRYREELYGILVPRIGLLALLWGGLTLFHILFVDYTGIIYVTQMFGPGSAAVEWTYFQKLILCALLMVAFRKWERYLPHHLLDDLATYSFSIYFLHGYLTLTAARIVEWENLSIPGNSLGFVAVVLVITGICVLFAKTVKLLTGQRSRLLVGS